MKDPTGKLPFVASARRAGRFARAAVYRAKDAADALLRRRSAIPPETRRGFVGGGDFAVIGQEFLGHLVDHAGLTPDDRVLDIGCGIGRIALPLLDFVSPRGSYEGFDIVPHGIGWCSTNITPRNPRFRFQLADVQNTDYNPAGRQAASAYRFPYDDDTFDVAFATSVFTHMLPVEVTNYLQQIRRVLKPGGRCFITWFLLNEESQRLLDAGKSSLDFRHRVGECLTTDPQVPEKALCYPESFVVDLYARVGLDLERPLGYGAWCGRPAWLTGQDVCIARKPAISP